jgi:hypothetical protein
MKDTPISAMGGAIRDALGRVSDKCPELTERFFSLWKEAVRLITLPEEGTSEAVLEFVRGDTTELDSPERALLVSQITLAIGKCRYARGSPK